MKNLSFSSRARRGFTLVEILIVIAIISLLAGIAFPVFSRAREGGRAKVCLSNMKQLGLAFAQYHQDNNRYPFPGNYQLWNNDGHWIKGGDDTGVKKFTDAEGGLANSTTFEYIEKHRAYVELGALFPFVKEVSVYTCPSAPKKDEKKLSYSMNCAITGMSDVRIRQPSQIVLLVDEGQSINDGYFWATDKTAGTDALMTTHNGGGNLLFIDGHVKFFPFKSFPLDKSAPGLANKISLTNPVRFLDPAFGPKGASVVPAFQDDPLAAPTNDSCFASLSSAPTTPPPL